MKIKALLEKRNAMLDELDLIATNIEVEVRALTDDETARVAELQEEVRKLDAAITFAESRAKEDADKLEDTEEREMEQNMEYEVRAVEQFLRKQDGEEVRAITAGATPGNLTIPTHLSTMIVEKLDETAALFSRTRKFTPVAGVLEVLREQTHGDAGFVGELTNLTPSDFTMDKIRLTQKRAGTAIELSQHIINDSGINVVEYALNLLVKRLGKVLDTNILVGTGDAGGQFEGMIGHADIENVETAATAAIAADDLVDLYNAMHPEYQGGAVFIMNRKTFNTVVKLKDANNNYYFIRDITAAGAGYRLFGLPVLITDAMPDVAAAATPILFANLDQAYATMVKKGMNLQHIFGDTTQALRGGHLLLLDGYFDGKVLNPDAAKFLKVK